MAGEVLLHLKHEHDRYILLGPLVIAAIWNPASTTPQGAAEALGSAPQPVRTVGVLNVAPGVDETALGSHWVAFACSLINNVMTLSVIDSSLPDFGVICYKSTGYTPNNADGDPVSFNVKWMPHWYPHSRLESLAQWHCAAWGCLQGAQVEVLVQGTEQQKAYDDWSCGRWAVANVAALLDSFECPRWEMDLDKVLTMSRQLMVAACHQGLLPQHSNNLARRTASKQRRKQLRPPTALPASPSLVISR